MLLLRHNEGFCIFLAFPESTVSNWEFYDASGFEVNIFEGVRIWKSLRSQSHDIHFVIPQKHCFFRSFPACSKLMFMIQNITMRLIKNSKHYKEFDCFVQKLQRIRFWTQTLQRRRCWLKKFQNVWDCEKNWIQKITIGIMLLLENGGFCIFRAFSEIIVLEQKTYKASELELNQIQRFIFWSEKFKRCEILKKKLN